MKKREDFAVETSPASENRLAHEKIMVALRD